jgi:Protein of unknown function (DUF2842)
MTQRQRKLAGTVAMFGLVIIYTFLALAVAVVLQVREANGFVEVVFYIVAGLAWVLPAGFIVSWMQRPDA